MAQLTVYAITSGNWSLANAWNAAANGSGTSYSDPQNATDTYVCDLNAKNMTLDKNVSVDQIRTGATNAGGTLVLSASSAPTVTVTSVSNGVYSNYNGAMITFGAASTLTINGDVQYASSNTSGMIPVGAGQALVINSGTLSNTSTGYAVVTAGSGNVTVTRANATAVTNSGNGQAIRFPSGSSGTLSITGDVTQTAGTGYGVVNYSTSASHVLNGNVSNAGGASSATYYLLGAGTLTWTPRTGVSAALSGTAQYAMAVAGTGAVVNVTGDLSTVCATGSTVRYAPIYLNVGTINWIGNRSLAAGSELDIRVFAGTLAFATASGSLSLVNRGMLSIQIVGGTFTTTASGNTAAIIDSGHGNAVIHGGTAANRAIIKNRPPRIGSRVVGVG